MTNLSGSPEDHGPAPSQNGGQSHDSEAIDLDNKMVSDIVNGGSSVANGWHHFDEDSNLSFDSGSPSQRNKRKLSVDSADSAELKKRSKLARTLLEVRLLIDFSLNSAICRQTFIAVFEII